MVRSVLHYLVGDREGLYVDVSLGAAGHTVSILDATAPGGQVIGIDRDPAALVLARERLQSYQHRVTIVRADYRRLAEVLAELGKTEISGVLFDPGLSSMQLDDSLRGFSYAMDGPLDMRADPGEELTAGQVVNEYSEKKLTEIFFIYGEERRSRQAAAAIVRHRRSKRITGTRELAELLRPVLAPQQYHRSLARIWMALRIAVNDELSALAAGLAAGVSALAVGGRVVVLSYHSHEDRVVKTSFREWSRRCRCAPISSCTCGATTVLSVLTRRPVTAPPEEVAQNPRAHSAKLRAAQKVAPGRVKPLAVPGVGR